jgi:hypothetical protein
MHIVMRLYYICDTKGEVEMAKTEKPNILVIWGDNIGISNLNCSRATLHCRAAG